MDLNKAKYHLKRIDTLLNLHPDGLTPLDRDIILEDIRRLYDEFIEWPKQSNSPSAKPVSQPEESSLPKGQPSTANETKSNNIYSTPAVEIPDHSQIQQPASPSPTVASQPTSSPLPHRVETPNVQTPPPHSPNTQTPTVHRPAAQAPTSYQYSSVPVNNNEINRVSPSQQDTVEEIKPSQPSTQQPVNQQVPPQYNPAPQTPAAQGINTPPSPLQYRETEAQGTQSGSEIQPSPEVEQYPRTQYVTTPQHKEETPSSNRGQDQVYHRETTTSQHSSTTVDNSQFSELFDVQMDSDLSGRLGNAKIENLNSVLGINDKILYINQLFGGEAIPFQEALKKFQSFYTYAEAKEFAISELVEDFHWSKPEKKAIVNAFMKQVRRLY
ncbi:hypothetical protein [Membranihabitans marinus]|uniref:hypothetical protein n=1 Tax=Membranihabitans marinus TaxID=1227546 RepID=UPI001F2C462F|nr:hypothetical protein [Membranihabitans marinus]